MDKIKAIIFKHDAMTVEDLQHVPCEREFQVVKVIELRSPEYRRFARTLYKDQPCLEKNRELTCPGPDGILRCIFVTTRNRRDGVLVDSSGGSGIRNAAYIQNKEQLELEGVPVEQYEGPTKKNHRSEPER